MARKNRPRKKIADEKKSVNMTTGTRTQTTAVKRLRTSFGEVDVSISRDRKEEFEPQVLKKNQTSISQDIEEKILSVIRLTVLSETEMA